MYYIDLGKLYAAAIASGYEAQFPQNKKLSLWQRIRAKPAQPVDVSNVTLLPETASVLHELLSLLDPRTLQTEVLEELEKLKTALAGTELTRYTVFAMPRGGQYGGPVAALKIYQGNPKRH